MYSLPDYRPLTVDYDALVLLLQNLCHFQELPLIMKLEDNVSIVDYKNVLTIVKWVPANTKLHAQFVVKQEDHTLGLSSSTISDSFTESLPYSLPCDMWCFRSKPNTSASYHITVLGTLNNGLFSIPLPNIYPSGQVCMGLPVKKTVNPLNPLDVFNLAAFDTTALNYGKGLLQKTYSWDLDTKEQLCPFSKDQLLTQGSNDEIAVLCDLIKRIPK